MARVSRRPRAARGSTAHSFSCTDAELAQIGALAAAREQSVSAYAVQRALTVTLPSVAQEANVDRRLVLDAQAQREVHEWMGHAAKHAERWSQGLVERVELVWRATMLEMLGQGRGEEMRALLAQVLGEERGRQAAERFEQDAQARDWLP